MMKGRLVLTLAAAATTLLGAAAQANDFTGRELQNKAQADAQNRSRINWRGEIGYRWIDRTFDGFGGEESFNSHELAGKLTGTYRNWFITGGYSHSIASSDLGSLDTDTWGASVTGGYQFHLNRNFTVAPFVGWSWANTNVDGFFGDDADLGVGGFNLGVGFKWTPGYKASKPYPKWTVFGSFAYFPSLGVSSDIDDAGGDGENAWLASVGVEHNFSSRTFANLYYQYGQFNVDGPFGGDFKQRDHRLGINAGIRF